MNRRTFLASSAAATLSTNLIAKAADSVALSRDHPAEDNLSGRVFKTLKYNMVGVGSSLTEKFEAARRGRIRSD